MKNDPIVQHGNPVLRKLASAVPLADIKNQEIQDLLKKMDAILVTQEDGVALAAPQVDVSKRIFIVSKIAWKKYTNQPRFYINPVIIKKSKTKVIVDEGCLSVRYLYGKMTRYEQVKVRAYNEKGEEFEMGASGLLAQIFQHEIDHLNGILFSDTAWDVETFTEEEVNAMRKKLKKEKEAKEKLDKKAE